MWRVSVHNTLAAPIALPIDQDGGAHMNWLDAVSRELAGEEMTIPFIESPYNVADIPAVAKRAVNLSNYQST